MHRERRYFMNVKKAVSLWLTALDVYGIVSNNSSTNYVPSKINDMEVRKSIRHLSRDRLHLGSDRLEC